MYFILKIIINIIKHLSHLSTYCLADVFKGLFERFGGPVAAFIVTKHPVLKLRLCGLKTISWSFFKRSLASCGFF